MHNHPINTPFELLLCSTDLSLIQASVNAGVDGVIVEWENIEGDRSPVLTSEMIKTLEKVRSVRDAWVICRLNTYYKGTKKELALAIAQKADEIWLPKVQSLEEVTQVLNWANNQVKVGIVIETVEAMNLSPKLATLPLHRVHIGLNDLGENLGNPHPFYALIDGTVEKILQNFKISTGFGGLTLPDKGDPIPCHLLMRELTRLGYQVELTPNA
jgi:citrate lyase beta subunit